MSGFLFSFIDDPSLSLSARVPLLCLLCFLTDC